MGSNERVCFIFNPSANGGKASRDEDKIRHAAAGIWPGSKWLKTEPGEPFWSKLKEEAGQYDMIVACGGDGTVHKTGNVAADSGALLGVIPLGSGNDFAKMNGIPDSPNKALNLLTSGSRRSVDLIRCSGDINCWCLNSVGLGLDGLANQYTLAFKQKIGRSGYIFGALKAILKSVPATLKIRKDEGEIESINLLMLTACIGFREGGRFIVAPQARNDDGVMELLMVKPMNKFSLMLTLPQFLFWFPSYIKTLERGSCRNLQLSSDTPLHIHVDGEFSGETVKQISYMIHEKALTVVAE